MQNENTRNTIIFIVCTVAILFLYQVFVLQPEADARKAALKRQQEAAQAAAPASVAPGTNVAGVSPTDPPPTIRDRNAVIQGQPRVRIDTPSLSGSILLTGGRVDDLFLKNYDETLEDDSPPVELLRPVGARHAYFAQTGWAGQNLPGLPGDATQWRLASGDTLSVGRPVTLAYTAPNGLEFTRTVSVDDKYMFTVTDRVVNRGTASVTLAHYGSVQRHGVPADLGKTMILHEGGIGVIDGKLRQHKYQDWAKKGEFREATVGGWLGITDKYWLSALIPDQRERVQTAFRVVDSGDVKIHEAAFLGRPVIIAPGRQVEETTRLYAGAKRQEVLDAYGQELGLPRFDSAIDWGNFWFFTRPIFAVLEFFYKLVGNFGVAILLLTVAVKLVFFPLANKSYESMSKMKKVQPMVEDLRKKYEKDPTKQQQELLALYQREKINPLAGCLPILIQIPVFYALYKVLFVTIEMRHAPFVGWIQDLSSRDPTTIFNLFGLIPWDPATAPLIGGFLNGPLHLGVWPLLYGLSMWLQTSMNPPPPDPIQRQIFGLFPIIFTFVMAPFAVGLVIYWTWNNLLSILQQYVIMRRFGVDNPIDDLIKRFKGGGKAPA